MLPNLSSLDDAAPAASKDKGYAMEVSRYGPPDTHVATWLCDANDPRCTEGYGGQAARTRQRTLTEFLTGLNLLHLVKDKRTVASLMDKYEMSLITSGAMSKMIDVALAANSRSFRPGMLTMGQTLLLHLSPSNEEAFASFNGTDAQRVQSETFFMQFDVYKLKIPTETLEKYRKRKATVTTSGGTFDVRLESVPEIHVKKNFKKRKLAVKVVQFGNTVFYTFKYWLRARNQLVFPAVDKAAVEKLLQTFAFEKQQLPKDWDKTSLLYDKTKMGVRVYDEGGQDVAIIDFMKFVDSTTQYNGFRTDGIFDLQANRNDADVRILAPEIFVVGKPAVQFSQMWEKVHGEFRDQYSLDTTTLPDHDIIQTPQQYIEYTSKHPSPFFSNIVYRNAGGNPHAKAMIAARKALIG